MTDKSDRRINPGPGKYEPDLKIWKKTNNTTIGKEKRENNDREKLAMPGPGKYKDHSS